MTKVDRHRTSGDLGSIDESFQAVDSLSPLAAEGQRVLAAVEAQLSLLVDRTTSIVARADEDRTQLQRFLEEFALEPSVFGELGQDGSTDEPDSPLFDLAAVRRDLRTIDDTLSQGSSLNQHLESAVQVVRSCQEQLGPQRWSDQIRDTADVRIQQAMNSAREDERRRLAREVHDGPAQVLANAIFGIEIAEQVGRRSPDQVPEELNRLRSLLKDGIAEIRRFMFDLRPAMLEEQGLVPTARRYIDDYSRFFGKRVTFTVTGTLPVLSADEELTFFRVIQEALQNIHKHANTDNASVEIKRENDNLTLVILDEGRGFRPNQVTSRSTGGAGLPGMRDRAKLIGAELEVVSMPGAGTEVKMTLAIRARTQTGLLRPDQPGGSV